MSGDRARRAEIASSGSGGAVLPARARAVVIGAGIVGNSLVYHLARLGWDELLLLDTGPLPNPGGSTGHASNFIFPIDHSREVTRLTLESMRQYRELGVFTETGGFELARSAERLEELRRRMASAGAWGVEGVALLSPAEVRERVPFVESSVVLAGLWIPTVGVVDSVGAGTAMREAAQASGALRVCAETEVLGIEVERGRVRAVRTSRGELETDTVVVACGVWSPRVAGLAGAAIPLTPAVHQMIEVGPVARFAGTPAKGITYPVVRDMDTMMYERQEGDGLEIGSYAHRPILHDPEEIPSLGEAERSPTELPFTSEDFARQLEDARELVPEVLNDPAVQVRYAINGLLSLTPDGLPLLGETPEVHGLWSAAAVWIKEGPGVGKAVAEWLTHGEAEIDLQTSDIARFYPHQRTRAHVRARAAEGFNKTYGIVHPAEQWQSNRELRLPPFRERERELGAVFFEAAGWERPHWYAANAPLLEEFADQLAPREAEWDGRWWSPIVNAEHLAMRARAGLFDLSAFCVFDVLGAGALETVQGLALRQMDVPAGRVVYTPVLTPRGGFRSDLTIMRLGPEQFRVVTGGAHGMADLKWFADHLSAGAVVVDLTSSWCTLGLWGPRARDILAGLVREDVSAEAFPFASWRWLELGPLQVLASRISYVGELGWELYAPIEQGARLWDLLWEAGEPQGLVAAGIGVYGTTGRLEKSYRAFGYELDGDYDVVEAGLAWGSVKPQHFIGKDAYLAARASEPAAQLCTLSVLDHRPSGGVARFMLGHEPVTTSSGAPLRDAKGRRSFVTSAGAAPSLGRYLLLAYLPPEQAIVGRELAVEYMGERYPVRVEVVGSEPLFDPENARVRS